MPFNEHFNLAKIRNIVTLWFLYVATTTWRESSMTRN